jgi:predicted XRE-type DNA-binding protein
MTKAGRNNPHIGSSFDDFLEEEGIAAEVTERAVREVIAHLVLDHMERAKLTKTEMAARMHTSRQAVDRLLDPESGGLTLDTLERAANAVGKRVRISFDDVAA